MVIRAYGVEGLQERIREHCALAREFAERVEHEPLFELVLPPRFSTVCFRLRGGDGDEQDEMNRRLVERVNDTGSVFLSHASVGGRVTPRLTLGNVKTGRAEVDRAWHLLLEASRDLEGR